MIQWKTVPRYPNYLVSDTGLVKRKGSFKLLKQGDGWCGYPSVCLYRGTRESSRTFLVAHLVLLVFVGPCPKGMECCHRDGNKLNNCLDNLRWDTHQSNVLDAVRHGTHVANIGPKNGMSKINEWDALRIYDRCHDGESLKTLAQEYGLHPEYIRLIKNGKYWGHLYALIV